MGYLAKQALIANGTPEQLAEAGIDADQERTKQFTSGADYERITGRSLKERPPAPVDQAKQIATFLKAHIGGHHQEIPAAADHDTVKAVLWRAFRMLIKEETGIELRSDSVRKDPELASHLANMTRWIRKDSEGDWDPGKSLYIYGTVGVGKSTLAKAAYTTLAWIHHTHQWPAAFFGFASMDQLLLEVYTTENLDGIRKLGQGNQVIDELKLQHAEYRHYGNKLPLLETILLARHELWKKGSRTIITTNVPPGKFTEVVDGRLRDRMKQEYHKVEFKGDNKRHAKERIKNQ